MTIIDDIQLMIQKLQESKSYGPYELWIPKGHYVSGLDRRQMRRMARRTGCRYHQVGRKIFWTNAFHKIIEQ